MLKLISTIFDTISTSAVGWLDTATDSISGIGKNASLDSIPTVVLTIFIILSVVVIVTIVLRWMYSEKDGNTTNAKTKEGLLEGRKATVFTIGIFIVGVMFTFIVFKWIGFV